MPTGYEVKMYTDISSIARSLRTIAEELKGLHELVRREIDEDRALKEDLINAD